jgi:hypothetical protein
VTHTRVAISPVIPTVAVLLLAALWGASVFAGWGLAAFCAGGETARVCAERLEPVYSLSGVFAVVAGCCAVLAWLRSAQWFPRLMTVAIAAWVAAEGVLFFGGMLAR